MAKAAASEEHVPSGAEFGGEVAPPTPSVAFVSGGPSNVVGRLPERFVVGDLARLDNSVAKKFRGQEGQVTKLTQKLVTCDILTGKQPDVGTQFKVSACTMLHPSTLR